MSLFGPSLLAGILIFLLVGFGLLLLALPHPRQHVKFLLAALCISFGLIVLDIYAQLSGFYLEHPSWSNWLGGLILLFGPLVFHITRVSLYADAKMNWRQWIHFLPFGLFFFLTILVFHIKPLAYKEEYVRQALGGSDLGKNVSLVAGLIILLSTLAYLLYSLRMIRVYRNELKAIYASVDGKNVEWLSRLIYGFLGIILVSVLIQVVNYVAEEDFWPQLLLLLLAGLIMGLILYSIYRGMLASNLFAGLSEVDRQAAKSLADTDAALVAKLEQHLQEEQAFLNPDLTLAILAEQLGTTPRTLSQTINGAMGRSFFDLINHYRIAFTKSRLAEASTERITVAEVMYEAGFNSKSSFNTAFKKHAGMTPSQWKKQVSS